MSPMNNAQRPRSSAPDASSRPAAPTAEAADTAAGPAVGLRTDTHPFSGMLYEELGDGLVRVGRDDQTGIFRWDGSWVEGAVRHADPHFLQWVGGPTLPGEQDVVLNRIPRVLLDRPADDTARIAAERYLGGTADPSLMPYAKYVGDPGRQTPHGKRSTGISYPEVLEGEQFPERIPDTLRMQAPMPGGVTKVAVDRYFSREIYDQEIERIWKRVWQVACHVDDIPEVGDYHVYEIAHLSYIVTRVGPNLFKAYNNACLHRGRKLCDASGRAARQFRCPFHGWSWGIDGALLEIPLEWDFPGVREDVGQLREVQVGTWGGFVFVNPDPAAESLESFLGSLPEHYEKYDYEKRYKASHVAKIVRCNWKMNQDAFLEGYHIVATHPQGLVYGGDGANHQYDVFGNWARAVVIGGSTRVRAHSGIHPPTEGIFKRRQIVADATREAMRETIGDRVDVYADTELIDGQYNNVFPNFSPWGGFSLLIYVFKPYGDDPNLSVHEIMYLRPWGEDKPKPPAAPVHWLGVDDPWTDAPELGPLARTLNQDSNNLPKQQQGVRAKVDPHIYLSAYAEGKVRHFHHLYDQWMAAD